MDFLSFTRLIEWIMQETGLPEDTAAKVAAQIGDTPEADADGNWTVTVDGATLSIKPML